MEKIIGIMTSLLLLLGILLVIHYYVEPLNEPTVATEKQTSEHK